MARQPRFEYPGAVYHVMARGNGGDAVFVNDDDRRSFLFRLGHVCASHGYPGKDTFKDKLLRMLERPPVGGGSQGSRGKSGARNPARGNPPPRTAAGPGGIVAPEEERRAQDPTRHPPENPHLGEQRMDRRKG